MPATACQRPSGRRLALEDYTGPSASPVIPGERNRKRAIRYDQRRYRGRHLIENAFCRIKEFRRVATRYDKLPTNSLSGVALANAWAFWL